MSNELSEKRIEKGNNQISIFIGYTGLFKNRSGIYYGIIPDAKDENQYEMINDYHEDWNLLMPICKKIIEMYADMRQDIFSGLQECDIVKTWCAVIEFINFWNDKAQKKYTWSNVPFPYSPMPKGEIIHYSKTKQP